MPYAIDSVFYRIGELKGEWEDSGYLAATSLTSNTRALWKTPCYVRVNSWARVMSKDQTKEEVRYKITRISRDGQQSTMLKKFSKFYTFWISLPIGITRHLKNTFPQLGLFRSSDESNDALDTITTHLDEWFRELSLDEKCITHPKVLAALDNLFSSARITASPTVDIEPDNLDTWVVIPENAITSLPGRKEIACRKTFDDCPLTYPSACPACVVPLHALRRQLPAKIMLSLLFGSGSSMDVAGSITGSDLSEEQLRKDLSRDRIVIHGKRIAGANTSLEAIIDQGVHAAQAVTTFHSAKPFSTDILRDLCRRALVQVSRTESAFASHYALQSILDPSTDPNIVIVPEATLAQPLLMQFRVAPVSSTAGIAQSALVGPPPAAVRRSTSDAAAIAVTSSRPRRMSVLAKMDPVASMNSSDASLSSVDDLTCRELICDIQATTVFRFVDADRMEGTVLQVRVTFCKSIKVKNPDENLSGLSIKPSEPSVCLNPFGVETPRAAASTNPFGAESADGNDDFESAVTTALSTENVPAKKEENISKNDSLYMDSNTVIVIEQDTHLTDRDFM